MSFAAWKKRSSKFNDVHWAQRSQVESLCQAAYKAGERQGRKDVEKIAQRANELRELLYYTRRPTSAIL